MKTKLKFISVLLITAIVFTSCKKETTTQNPPIPNEPPVAYAGTDQDIMLPKDSIELRGTGIDADGIIVSYEWTKVSGPSQFSIVSSSTAITSVINLKEGRYEFQLKVIDNSGHSAMDLVLVTVKDPNPSCAGCWDY